MRSCSNNACIIGTNGVALLATFEACQFESSGDGLIAFSSTNIMAHDCVAAGNFTGFFLEQGARGVLLDCTAANNKNTGVSGDIGGTLTLQGCAILGNPTGVEAGSGGQITLLNCTVSSNSIGTEAINGGAAVRTDGCAITDNGQAYRIITSQSATISSRLNNTVANNTAAGSIGSYNAQ